MTNYKLTAWIADLSAVLSFVLVFVPAAAVTRSGGLPRSVFP
jgi:hypothetical protein